MNELTETYFTGLLVGLLIAWPVWRLLQIIAYLIYVAYDNLRFEWLLWQSDREDQRREQGALPDSEARRQPRHRKM